jgi:hypothetical protein
MAEFAWLVLFLSLAIIAGVVIWMDIHRPRKPHDRVTGSGTKKWEWPEEYPKQ